MGDLVMAGNDRSKNITQGVARSPNRSMYYAMGYQKSDFDNPMILIPKYELNKTYHCYGCFCSPECATAHLMEENIDSSSKFERYHLINHIYSN